MIKNFFNQQELQTLRKSILENLKTLDTDNNINLKNADDLINKIKDYFSSNLNIAANFIRAGVILASESTMRPRMGTVSEGWHVDGACRFVDGDCYNVWIPIYNDSSNSGIEIITHADNSELYTELGDQTYDIEVTTQKGAPWIFDLIKAKIKSDSEMIFFKPENAKLVITAKNKIYITRLDSPVTGDIAIFKQSEIHRGFHYHGIRIVVNLKFMDSNAKLNSKPSNTFYRLFEIYSKGQNYDYELFSVFINNFIPKQDLSKHGLLERELINTVLKNEYLKYIS